jgi:hypothetical protein
LIDWYVDHPEEKDASWFRRLYGSARCMPADDLHLKKNSRKCNVNIGRAEKAGALKKLCPAVVSV